MSNTRVNEYAIYAEYRNRNVLKEKYVKCKNWAAKIKLFKNFGLVLYIF